MILSATYLLPVILFFVFNSMALQQVSQRWSSSASESVKWLLSII